MGGSDPPTSTVSASTEERAPQRPTKSDIRTLLKTLVRAETLSSDSARAALKALKSIARTCGAYLTAAEIQTIVSGWPRVDEAGTPLYKDRAYGIAAELYIHQIYKEINAIEAEGQALGPSVFESYCVELIDCLFSRKNSRKGVEAPLAIWDTLLAKAINGLHEQQVYLTLADRAISTTVDVSTEKHEKESMIQLKEARIRRREGGAEPDPVSKASTIDSDLLTYLRDTRRRFNQLQLIMKDVETKFQPSGEGRVISNPQQMAAYLQTLLTQASGVECHMFTGILREKIGLVLEGMERGSGQESFRAAANYYELQADRDAAMSLNALAQQRYKRATKLYVMASSPEDSQRVTQKAQFQSAPPAPQQAQATGQ